MPETMAFLAFDDVRPLREAFAPHFPIGAVLGQRTQQGQEAIEASLATRHFSALTAENSMKPEALQPAEGRFTFDEADRLVEIAEACGAVPRHQAVIGRVSLWGTHDGSSWLNGFPIRGRTDYSLLFDRQRRPKPAFFAVQQTAQAAR